MKKMIQLFYLTLRHWLSRASLQRVPEPHTITDQNQFVDDYNKAMGSVMMFPYLIVLDLVHRVRSSKNSRLALDLCCGPGHFTRMLVNHLNCDHVWGADLSKGMLEHAKTNAQQENLEKKLSYVNMDVTRLDRFESKSFDLVSFMDGAHHMNSLEEVAKILQEADRVTKPDGMIICLDPIRQKTEKISDQYHKVVGKSYLDQGLVHFNQDFYDSIRASWTPDELFTAIPKNSKRKWVQLIPFGLPVFQVIIGLPEGRENIFVRESLPQAIFSKLMPKHGKADWNFLKFSFQFAKKRFVTPRKVSEKYDYFDLLN